MSVSEDTPPLTEYKRITKCLKSTPSTPPSRTTDGTKIKKKRKSPLKLAIIEVFKVITFLL